MRVPASSLHPLALVLLAVCAVGATGCSATGEDTPDTPPEAALLVGEYAGEVNLLVDGQAIQVPVADVDGQLVFEGDILMEGPIAGIHETDRQRGVAQLGLASMLPVSRWPNGILVYDLPADFPDPIRIHDAIVEYRRFTNVRFVQRTTHTTFVQIQEDTICSAHLGRNTTFQGRLTLQRLCGASSAIHEFGHALGFFHEQSRADRDSHVRILFANVTPGREFNFQTYPVRGYPGLDVGPYDFDSIMHYPSKAASRNGLPTIERIDGSPLHTSNNARLSGLDIAAINQMYPTATTSGAFCEVRMRSCSNDALLPVKIRESMDQSTCRGEAKRASDQCGNEYGQITKSRFYDAAGELVETTLHSPDDRDSDNRRDANDNCPDVSNFFQGDTDEDGIGNECDVCPRDPDQDADGDGVCGDRDRCPAIPDPDQTDTDRDQIGDACDPCPKDRFNDIDSDEICGNLDLCPSVADPEQSDSDRDGIGDACDPCPNDPNQDADGDGVCGDLDVCPTTADPIQLDSDGDGAGNACDACPYDPNQDEDGDGICGDVDVCPRIFDPGQVDSDGNGIGDACETPFGRISPAGASCSASGSDTRGLLLCLFVAVFMLRRGRKGRRGVVTKYSRQSRGVCEERAGAG